MTEEGANPPEPAPKPRVKGIYIGAPACFALELAARHIAEAYGAFRSDDDGWAGGIYVVGSALQRPDWRDIDVRFIMSDAHFAREFPNAGEHWEHDAKWLLLTVSISKWLSDQTGLPIDFQFQPQTLANDRHKGSRNSVGIRYAKSHD